MEQHIYSLNMMNGTFYSIFYFLNTYCMGNHPSKTSVMFPGRLKDISDGCIDKNVWKGVLHHNETIE